MKGLLIGLALLIGGCVSMTPRYYGVLEVQDKSFKYVNEYYKGAMTIYFAPHTERYYITYWYCPTSSWFYGWSDSGDFEDIPLVRKLRHGFEINYDMPVRAEIISYIHGSDYSLTKTHFEYFNMGNTQCPT